MPNKTFKTLELKCPQTSQLITISVEYVQIPGLYPIRYKKHHITNDYCPQDKHDCPFFKKEERCPLYKQFPTEMLQN